MYSIIKNRKEAEKMKKLISTILIIMMAFALLTACSPKQEETETEKGSGTGTVAEEKSTDDDAAGEDSADAGKETAGIGALSAQEYASYADALKANEAAIRASGEDWQGDVNGNSFENNVLLYDLNGDGNSELIIMLGTKMGGVLHILTMKDGKAVECEYDVVPDVPYVEENEAPFKFVVAGGGTDYMIYSGKERGAFYIAHNIWDTVVASRSTKYTMSDDGVIKAETCIENTVNLEPAETPVDEYELDGKDVSAEDGAAVFTAHRNDYKDLLMYNLKYGSVDGSHSYFRVFQKLKTDKPLASGYDAVMEQLR